MTESITLSQLQALIKQGIDQAHPLPYWVTAEISELKVNYSGHCYLELVEKGGANHVPRAKVSAVIWRSTFQMLDPYFREATGQPLSAGLNVLVKGVVSYHELYGLSLQIIDIDPNYTLGDMQRQRQETIARLQQEGIFDMNREMPLPQVMQRIAVVSSRNAAGYQDFMRELGASSYRFEVELFDSFMQGAGAEEAVIGALERVAERLDEFDVLVLIRGGGSQSDLGAFDSYRLCCHLAQFPLPVLTGIGHDKDQSVADLVAAVSLKTPTAVAVYLKETSENFEACIEGMFGEIAAAAWELLEAQKQRLQQGTYTLRMVSSELIHGLEMRLEQLQSALHLATGREVQRQLSRLESYRTRLQQASGYYFSARSVALDVSSRRLSTVVRDYLQARNRELKWMGDLVSGQDPRRILQRGFAVVRRNGRAVTGAEELQRGDSLDIQLYDGRIEAEVRQTQTTKS